MAKYSTAQRKLLLDFLSSHPDESFSAQQIARQLQEEKISLSAVYRNLAALETEGKVKPLIYRGHPRETSYQYVGAEDCQGQFHLSCIRCGKSVHMKRENAELLVRHLAVSEGFSLDSADTVLSGLCAKCRKS